MLPRGEIEIFRCVNSFTEAEKTTSFYLKDYQELASPLEECSQVAKRENRVFLGLQLKQGVLVSWSSHNNTTHKWLKQQKFMFSQF